MHRRRPVIACPPVIHYAEDGEEEAFVKHRLLGYGGFAAVYEVERVSDGSRMAAKVLPLSSLADPNKLRRVQNEIDINQLLHHPHLVTFLGSFQDEASVYLLQELCCVTLCDLLKRVGRLTELQAAHVLWQVLSAVEHLHGCGVAHRDLKLSNTFLARDGTVKLGDLGLACHLHHPAARRRSTCGSLMWMAPEVLRPGPTGYGLEVDIWALGVMLFTLIVGRAPWRPGSALGDGSTDGGQATAAAAAGGGGAGGGDGAAAAATAATAAAAGAGGRVGESTYDRILAGRYVPPGPGEGQLGHAARELVGALLSVDPAARPSLAAVRRHAFFAAHGLTPAPPAPTAASESGPPAVSPKALPQDVLPLPWPPPPAAVVATDLRVLLGEAGAAALAALNGGGAAGAAGDGDSTSGSYMELSQSELCSAALTTATTATGAAMGAADATCLSGDPLPHVASVALPMGMTGLLGHGGQPEERCRARPHSHTLTSGPPQRLLAQALRSCAPFQGHVHGHGHSHGHGSGRNTHGHAHAHAHAHGTFRSHHRHVHLHAHAEPAAHQAVQQGAQQARVRASQHQSATGAGVAVPSSPATDSTYTPFIEAPAGFTASDLSASNPGEAADGSSLPAQSPLAHSHLQPTQSLPAHVSPRELPSPAQLLASCQAHLRRPPPPQPHPPSSAARVCRPLGAVPGAGADQDISLLEVFELEPAGGEDDAVAATVAAASARLRHAGTDLSGAPCEQPQRGRYCGANGVIAASGVASGDPQLEAEEKKLLRSCTTGPNGVATRRSRMSRPVSGGGNNWAAGRSHDGAQLAVTVGAPVSSQRPSGGGAGEELYIPSPLRPVQEPQLWPHRRTTADYFPAGPSCLGAVTSGGGEVAGGVLAQHERLGPMNTSPLRAAFLSQCPTAMSRRLLNSRSACRSRRSIGIGQSPGAVLRSGAAAGGCDPEGENDGSSDTARSYADSLEAMLLGGGGRNAAALRSSRRGPAPLGPRGGGAAAAAVTGLAPTEHAAAAPPLHPQIATTAQTVVLRHGRGSGSGLRRQRGGGGASTTTTTATTTGQLSPVGVATAAARCPQGLLRGVSASLPVAAAAGAGAHPAPGQRPLPGTTSMWPLLPPERSPCVPAVSLVEGPAAPAVPPPTAAATAAASPSCDSETLSLAVFAAAPVAAMAAVLATGGSHSAPHSGADPGQQCGPESLVATPRHVEPRLMPDDAASVPSPQRPGFRLHLGPAQTAQEAAPASAARDPVRQLLFRRGAPPRCSSDVAPGGRLRPQRPSRDQQPPSAADAAAANAAHATVAVAAPAALHVGPGLGKPAGRRSHDRCPGSSASWHATSGHVARSAPSQLFRACVGCCAGPSRDDARGTQLSPSSSTSEAELDSGTCTDAELLLLHGDSREPSPLQLPRAQPAAQGQGGAQPPLGLHACESAEYTGQAQAPGPRGQQQQARPQQQQPRVRQPRPPSAPADYGETFSFQLHPWREMSLTELRRARARLLLLQREEAAEEAAAEAEWGSRGDDSAEGAALQRSSVGAAVTEGLAGGPAARPSRGLQPPSAASAPVVGCTSGVHGHGHSAGAWPGVGNCGAPPAAAHPRGVGAAVELPSAGLLAAHEPPWHASATRGPGRSGVCGRSDGEARSSTAHGTAAGVTATSQSTAAWSIVSPTVAGAMASGGCSASHGVLPAACRTCGPASEPAVRAADLHAATAAEGPYGPLNSRPVGQASPAAQGDAAAAAPAPASRVSCRAGGEDASGDAPGDGAFVRPPPRLCAHSACDLPPLPPPPLPPPPPPPSRRLQALPEVEHVLRHLESLDTGDLPPLPSSCLSAGGGASVTLSAGGSCVLSGGSHQCDGGTPGSPGPGPGPCHVWGMSGPGPSHKEEAATLSLSAAAGVGAQGCADGDESSPPGWWQQTGPPLAQPAPHPCAAPAQAAELAVASSRVIDAESVAAAAAVVAAPAAVALAAGGAPRGSCGGVHQAAAEWPEWPSLGSDPSSRTDHTAQRAPAPGCRTVGPSPLLDTGTSSFSSLPQRQQAPPPPLPRRRLQPPRHASGDARELVAGSVGMQEAEALAGGPFVDDEGIGLECDSDLSLGELVGELRSLDCSLQAAAAAAGAGAAAAPPSPPADARAAVATIPAGDEGTAPGSAQLPTSPLTAAQLVLEQPIEVTDAAVAAWAGAGAHEAPPPVAARLPQLEAGGPAGWADVTLRASVPVGAGAGAAPGPELLPEMNPEALAELASRLRSRSFKEGLAGSFTYRPSRMMPPTHTHRPRASSAVTAPVGGGQGAGGAAAGADAATAAAAAAAAAETAPAQPEQPPPPPVQLRDVLAVKWLDYSSKYGLSYMLSNGAVGVLFRDGTQLVHEPAAGHAWLLGAPCCGAAGRASTLLQPQPLPRSAQAIDLDAADAAAAATGAAAAAQAGRGGIGGTHAGRGLSHDTLKKLRLLRSFREVMLGGPTAAGERGGGGGGSVPRGPAAAASHPCTLQRPGQAPAPDPMEPPLEPLPEPLPEPPAAFVSWWCRTEKALVLVISSGTLQALFTDGSELVLREAEDEVDYLASDGSRQTSTVRAVRMAGAKNSIARRLQYATTLLHSRGRQGP